MSKQIYIDSNGNEVLVSGTIINDNNLPHYTGTPTAGSTAEAIGNCLRCATFELSQAINAGQTQSYTITRTDLDLPTGAKAKTCVIRQRASSSANQGFYYSGSVSETGTDTVKGILGNSSSYNLTYYLVATVFYTF